MSPKCLFSLLVTAFLFTTKSFSQTDKGTFTIGNDFGNIANANVSASKYSKQFNFNLSPTAGYFIKKNWEVGGGFQFGINKAKFDNYYSNGSGNTLTANLRMVTTGANIYSRYYFRNSSKLKPFVVAGIVYQHRKGTKLNNIPSSYSPAKYSFVSNSFIAHGGVGLAYFVNRNIAFTTSLQYQRHIGGGYGGNGNLNLNFGIHLFFGNKKKK
jgi:outer membrane protein W